MQTPGALPVVQRPHSTPHEPLAALFLRFLKFGLLAWGGPAAQIAMIRQELVEQEGWISRERFNRVLAVYQVLPGPEAHELCVYFGTLARGKLGGTLAGLGFMLPGFVLMFALSWFYRAYGIGSPITMAIFLGFKAAVVALIVRAIHQIGRHALTEPSLWVIAILGAASQFLGISFLLSLALAGLAYTFIKRGGSFIGGKLTSLLPLLALPAAGLVVPSVATLFISGLRSGLLTFGGAYTVVPFLQQDAVLRGGWMTNHQFLDGLALSSILPAPFIIFATFVGYIGGGPVGSVAITLGIFLPAFGFTIFGHKYFERLVDNPATHAFLDGVTAAVVGLIAATGWILLREALTTPAAGVIFLGSLLVLYRWKAKAAVAVVMLGAGLIGLLFFLARSAG